MDKRMLRPLTPFVFVRYRRLWICKAIRNLRASYAFVALGILIAMPFVVPLELFAEPAPNVTISVEALPPSSPYGEATVIRNIPYAARPTPQQNFDLYLPAHKTGQPFPLVIWIHGGAWMMGIKEWDNVKYLVRHGYAIASVDYRFSTEIPFPAQIQDCNAALNFILAHATNYGVNPKRFVVGGGSAGGHLALLLSLARDKKEFGADSTVKPLATLDFFGPADFTRMQNDLEAIHSEKGLELYKDAGGKLLGVPVEQSSANAKLASPINYVSAASPPVLILQGGKDDLVPATQSRRLHEALDQAGVKNQLIMVDAGHDGPLFSTPEIESKVVSFLNEVLEKPVQANAHLPE
jgi:acetyl esterase/lipase